MKYRIITYISLVLLLTFFTVSSWYLIIITSGITEKVVCMFYIVPCGVAVIKMLRTVYKDWSEDEV